jgi:hypothetical protein
VVYVFVSYFLLSDICKVLTSCYPCSLVKVGTCWLEWWVLVSGARGSFQWKMSCYSSAFFTAVELTTDNNEWSIIKWSSYAVPSSKVRILIDLSGLYISLSGITMTSKTNAMMTCSFLCYHPKSKKEILLPFNVVVFLWTLSLISKLFKTKLCCI